VPTRRASVGGKVFYDVPNGDMTRKEQVTLRQNADSEISYLQERQLISGDPMV
jgi:hypothetical protein